jgi:hypothetical protein
MFCISGFARAGKDEIAKRLISNHKAKQANLADPAKRHLADLYGFTEDQLFGNTKDQGDFRYPKNYFDECGLEPVDLNTTLPSSLIGTLKKDVSYWRCESRKIPTGISVENLPYVPLRLGNAYIYIPTVHQSFWLSPIEALQKYCELMNQMYLDSWIEKATRIHEHLTDIEVRSDNGKVEIVRKFSYHRMTGLIKTKENEYLDDDFIITCASDFRHRHEFKYVSKCPKELDTDSPQNFIPVFVRVKRPSIKEPPFNHRSETEQTKIPDSEFHHIINNDGNLEELRLQVDKMVERVKDANS